MVDHSFRFDKFKGYITSQIQREQRETRDVAAVRPAITLSRETGAGAITLGEKLAEYMNKRTGDSEYTWTVFDKHLVKKVLEDHDLPKRLESFMPEDKPKVLENVFGDMLGMHPPDWKLVQHTQDTIYRLAKMGNCILVGRGANIITRDLPGTIHLRLIGKMENRVVRCMDYYRITEAKARDLIRKQDRARRRYLLAYYDTEIEDPVNYHMVINVDLFSTDELVTLICNNIYGSMR